MDSLSLLKAEISKKRKSTQAESSNRPLSANGNRPAKRWRSRAEIEAEREKAYYAEEKAEAERKKKKEARRKAESNVESAVRGYRDKDTESGPSKGEAQSSAMAPNKMASSELPAQQHRSVEPPLSKQEVVRRLRNLKEPVTLFGEEAWDRFNRLRELELEREDGSKGQANIFQKKLREMQAKDAEDDVYRYTGAKMPQLDSQAVSAKAKSDANAEEEEAAISSKEDYVHFQIGKYMRLWQSEIDAMSKEERRTRKGRSLAVTYEQTKEWLKPLFKLLRKQRLEKKILDALKNIFEAAAEREYVRANSLYLEQLAIGNAPWPMGATMVGIHARAAREKIGEDKIAHLMNDDQTRKYIQAVKRLLTVAQRHFPTSLSKMIL